VGEEDAQRTFANMIRVIAFVRTPNQVRMSLSQNRVHDNRRDEKNDNRKNVLSQISEGICGRGTCVGGCFFLRYIQGSFEIRFLSMKSTTISTLAFCFILTACNPHAPLNQSNLDKVQQGMTGSEVKAILGEPSDTKSEPIPIVGGTKTTYTYNSGNNSATIVLKNDTVQSKDGHFDSNQ
jgi:hypothetical protein